MAVFTLALLVCAFAAPLDAYTDYAALLVRVANGDYLWESPALDYHGNHGISRLLVQWSDSPVTLSPALNAARNGIFAALCGLAAYCTRRTAYEQRAMLAGVGAMGCAMVLGAPIAWSTYLVFCLPALAFAHPLCRSAGGKLGWCVSFTLLALPDDWWQSATYVLPESRPIFASAKLAVVAGLYAFCVRRALAPGCPAAPPEVPCPSRCP